LAWFGDLLSPEGLEIGLPQQGEMSLRSRPYQRMARRAVAVAYLLSLLRFDRTT
jgi:hypothetical protein